MRVRLPRFDKFTANGNMVLVKRTTSLRHALVGQKAGSDPTPHRLTYITHASASPALPTDTETTRTGRNKSILLNCGQNSSTGLLALKLIRPLCFSCPLLAEFSSNRSRTSLPLPAFTQNGPFPLWLHPPQTPQSRLSSPGQHKPHRAPAE